VRNASRVNLARAAIPGYLSSPWAARLPCFFLPFFSYLSYFSQIAENGSSPDGNNERRMITGYTDWVGFLSALLTPINAIMLVYIAYEQYRINKERLKLEDRRFKHELYERRLAVFRGLMEYMAAVERDACVRGPDLANLSRVTAEKEFLFDANLCDWLEELYRKSVRMWTNATRLDNKQSPPTGLERDRMIEENAKLHEWLREQFAVARNKFAKDLKLMP
jgi:hypothetical protein